MSTPPGLLAPYSQVTHLYRDCAAIRHESILTRNYAGRPVCRLCTTRESVERDLLERCLCGADLAGLPHCSRCHGEGIVIYLAWLDDQIRSYDAPCPECAP